MILNTLNREFDYTDQILQQHGYSRLQITNLINSILGTSYNQENLVYNTEICFYDTNYSNPNDFFGLTNNLSVYQSNTITLGLGPFVEDLNNDGRVSTNLGTKLFFKYSSIAPNVVSFSQFKFV